MALIVIQTKKLHESENLKSKKNKERQAGIAEYRRDAAEPEKIGGNRGRTSCTLGYTSILEKILKIEKKKKKLGKQNEPIKKSTYMCNDTMQSLSKFISWNSKEIKVKGQSVSYKHYFDMDIKCAKDLLHNMLNIDSFNIVREAELF